MTYSLKAKVLGGRLVMDEPVDLPEGTELQLIPVPEDDTLDEVDREQLHAALRRSAAQFQVGQGIEASEALAALTNANSRK